MAASIPLLHRAPSRMKSRGPRTEPCGTPQVRGHDWDDALNASLKLFIYLILSLLTSSFKLKPMHWFRHMFCRLHVAYILYYKHYQAYLKYWRLRVGPIDSMGLYIFALTKQNLF